MPPRDVHLCKRSHRFVWFTFPTNEPLEEGRRGKMFLGIVYTRVYIHVSKREGNFPSKFYIPICRLLTPPSRIIKILPTIFCTRLKSSNRRSSR